MVAACAAGALMGCAGLACPDGTQQNGLFCFETSEIRPEQVVVNLNDPETGDENPEAMSFPCGVACTGSTPLCDTARATCVGCQSDSDCSTGLCDRFRDRCVTPPEGWSTTDDAQCAACTTHGDCNKGFLCVSNTPGPEKICAPIALEAGLCDDYQVLRTPTSVSATRPDGSTLQLTACKSVRGFCEADWTKLYESCPSNSACNSGSQSTFRCFRTSAASSLGQCSFNCDQRDGPTDSGGCFDGASCEDVYVGSETIPSETACVIP